MDSFQPYIYGKAFRRFIAWAVPLLLFRNRTAAPASECESRLAQGSTELRSVASKAADLRVLCLNMAQLFAQLFKAQEAEVEVSTTGLVAGFSMAWTRPHESSGKAAKSAIAVPLMAGENRIGVLRLRAPSNTYMRTDRHEIGVLAAEAALHINVALQLAKAAGAAASAERLRLAAQIHHGVAQYVAHALTRLQLSQRHIIEDPARAQEFLRNSLTCAQMAMDAVRATIYSLRYADKDAPRIATLLRATTERLRTVTAAEFHLDVADVGPLSPVIEVGIAAVAGEALTNAAKHADARHITVRLSKSNETVTLEVRDDGSGFAYKESLSGASTWGRFGLALMRDQVHRLGGTIQIQSMPSGGTLVKVMIPTSLRRPAATQKPDANSGHESEPLGAP